MKSDWTYKRISDIAFINPKESIKRGQLAKKIAMDKLQPFTRDVSEFELEAFSGGSKFRNGDTIMARITPCLENGKTAKVGILEDGEIGFGSTEYIVFRAKENTDEDFLYYLITSPAVREPAIKSMVGSSGRQRVQTDVVENLEIPIPSYEEQKLLGGILRSIDDKIYSTRKQTRIYLIKFKRFTVMNLTLPHIRPQAYWLIFVATHQIESLYLSCQHRHISKRRICSLTRWGLLMQQVFRP